LTFLNYCDTIYETGRNALRSSTIEWSHLSIHSQYSQPAPCGRHNTAPMAQEVSMDLTYFPLVISAVSGIAIILAILGIVLWIRSLAKRDIHFTELSPITGKLVIKGKQVVKILFDSVETLSNPLKVGHYEKDGKWVEGRQNLGFFFRWTGRVFYGLYPIYEIMKFDVSWSEYAGGITEKDGKRIPPSIVPKTTHCDSFNRFYTHAVLFHGVEMAHEGDKEIKGKKDDTSTTRIDAAMLVTLEITNIVKAIFKLEPEGIVFAQADTAIKAAFNDYARQDGMTWEKFKDEEKGNQDSEFVEHMKAHANKVLETLDIGMKLTVVELRYHDLTPSPGNEKLEESQTMVLVAQNEGDAAIALAERQAKAAKLRGKGTRQELEEVVKVVGKDGAVQLGSLRLIADTELRVWGTPTPTVPVVNIGGDEEGSKK
jgi:hypothetical protein